MGAVLGFFYNNIQLGVTLVRLEAPAEEDNGARSKPSAGATKLAAKPKQL